MRKSILCIIIVATSLVGCTQKEISDTGVSTTEESSAGVNEKSLKDKVKSSVSVARYSNSDFGIELDYPEDWQVVEGDSEVTFYKDYNANTGFASAYVNFTIADIQAENSTLLEIKDTMVSSFEQSDEMNVNGVEEITIDKTEPAYRLKLSSKNSSGEELKMDRMIASNYGYMYLLTYGAKVKDYDTYIGVYDTMLDTFNIMTYSMDENGQLKRNDL